MAKKQKRKFKEEELKQLESLFMRDVAVSHIATIMGLSDTWFNQLLKTDSAVQLAKKMGKAKAAILVKDKFWDKIKSGDWNAIRFYLETKEGYVKQSKLEISGPEGTSIKLQEMSDDELQAELIRLQSLAQ